MKIRDAGKRYTPFEVAVPKSITGTRRVKKYFASREEAAAYIVRVKQDGFHNADKRKAHLEPGKFSVTECIAMWQARHEGRSSVLKSQLRYVLGGLEKQFGHLDIAAVSHRELDVWLTNIKGSFTTRWNHYRVARRFFKWVHEWLEAIPRNPMIKMPKPEGNRNPIAILSPEQMQQCLFKVRTCEFLTTDAEKELIERQETCRRRLTAYLCLGGFAGLRTTEILAAHWEDIDWNNGEIFVRQPKQVRGARPRYVEILPALRRNLEPFSHFTGKILPGGQRTLYLLRKEMMNKVNLKAWPSNCLRHSFGTYHLAMWKNLAKTAHEMGHNENITKSNYAIPAKKADSTTWWNI